jgi:hypothetical protein
MKQATVPHGDPAQLDHDVVELDDGVRVWLPRVRPGWPRSVKRCIRLRRHAVEVGGCGRCDAELEVGDPVDGWTRLEVPHADGCLASDAALGALVVAHGLPREAFPALFKEAVT